MRPAHTTQGHKSQLPQATRPAYATQSYNSQPLRTMTAYSSGNFYPGSNYPPHCSQPSFRSHGSASSAISVESAQEVVESIRKSPTIRSMTRRIRRDAGNLEGTVNDLDNWFRSVDPNRYRTRNPWPRGMLSAWDRYKNHGDDISKAIVAYCSVSWCSFNMPWLSQIKAGLCPEARPADGWRILGLDHLTDGPILSRMRSGPLGPKT